MKFEPYQPTPSHPWSPVLAAHLVRRTGFGATQERVSALLELDPQTAVERIVFYADGDPELDALREARGGDLVDYAGGSEEVRVEKLRQDWVFRMVHSQRPFFQRMVLFWHDHFAVQASKLVHFPLVQSHLQTLRRIAGQPFREVIGGIAHDPGMLKFLDNRVSTKEAPNENWARELLELYCLGIDNYTQEDIVALARIFTGWTTRSESAHEALFDPGMHDAGDKRLMGWHVEGRSGANGEREGELALDHIVKQPECARHLATRLVQAFADPNPGAEVVDAFADVLREQQLDIRAALRILLGSSWFFEPARIQNMVRSPIELVVAQMQSLNVRHSDLSGAHLASRTMGMDLLEPPSVGGWDHASDWFSPMAADGRVRWAAHLAQTAHSPHMAYGAATVNLSTYAELPPEIMLLRMVRDLGLQSVRDEALSRVQNDWKRECGMNPFGVPAVRIALRLILELPENCLA